MKKISEVQKELKALGCNEKVATDLLVACGILENDVKEKILIEIGDVFELSWEGDKPEFNIHVVGVNKKEALCSFIDTRDGSYFLESHSLKSLQKAIIRKLQDNCYRERAKTWGK